MVQRSDGGSGLITILVVIAAIYVISQVVGNFAGNDDGSGEFAIACRPIMPPHLTASLAVAHTST